VLRSPSDLSPRRCSMGPARAHTPRAQTARSRSAPPPNNRFPRARTAHIEGSWLQSGAKLETLNVAALKRMDDRSPEQLYTDKRQAKGFECRGPVSFGQHEVGRSSMPEHCRPTRQFRHAAGASDRDVLHPHPDGFNRLTIGDPGAYDPFINQDIAATASFTHSKARQAFNSTSDKALKLKLYGNDVPGPGSYAVEGSKEKACFQAIDSNRSVFLARTLQRPAAGHREAIAQDPGRYKPQVSAVQANIRDSGASMRGTESRFENLVLVPKQTTADIGPGAYSDYWHSISHVLKESVRRQSAKKPGFGTMTPQRALPFEYSRSQSVTPDPGSYQQTIWMGPDFRKGKAKRLNASVLTSRTPRGDRSSVKV